MRKRQAFTLVEMMVSVALVLFIMVLLSQAFVASMQSFRTLKGIGDMEEKLRTAMSILKRDLNAQHFETRKSLSDAHFFDSPPKEGYLRISHGSPIVRPSLNNLTPANTYEETDADGIPLSRCTDHSIAFTVRLSGNSRDSYFTADIQNDWNPNTGQPNIPQLQTNNAYQLDGTYVGQIAEVAYFLKLSEAVPGGPQLFGLYRRQLLTVTNSSSINATTVPISKLTQTNAYAEMSCKPDPGPSSNYQNVYFNDASDLTIPQRRFGMSPLAGGSPDDTPVNWFGGDGGAFLPDPQNGYNPVPFPRPFYLYLLPSGYPTYGDPNYMSTTAALGYYLPTIAYTSLAGADILVNDVVSFEIKLLINDTNALAGSRLNGSNQTVTPTTPPLDRFVDLFDSQVYLNPLASIPLQPLGVLKSANPRFDFTRSQVPNPDNSNLTPMPRYDGSRPCVFDTWSSATVIDPNTGAKIYDYSAWKPVPPNSPSSTTLPLGYAGTPSGYSSGACPILALQITLRIWDRNTQQTRQMTLVQPM